MRFFSILLAVLFVSGFALVGCPDEGIQPDPSPDADPNGEEQYEDPLDEGPEPADPAVPDPEDHEDELDTVPGE